MGSTVSTIFGSEDVFAARLIIQIVVSAASSSANFPSKRFHASESIRCSTAASASGSVAVFVSKSAPVATKPAARSCSVRSSINSAPISRSSPLIITSRSILFCNSLLFQRYSQHVNSVKKICSKITGCYLLFKATISSAHNSYITFFSFIAANWSHHSVLQHP